LTTHPLISSSAVSSWTCRLPIFRLRYQLICADVSAYWKVTGISHIQQHPYFCTGNLLI